MPRLKYNKDMVLCQMLFFAYLVYAHGAVHYELCRARLFAC